MTEQKQNNYLMWGAIVVCLLTLVAIAFGACSVEHEKEVQVDVPNTVTVTTTATDTETSTVTQTSTVTTTETATTTATATGTSTSTGTGTRRPCADVTTYDEIQNILGQKCAGCHAGIDTYERTRTWWSQAPKGPGISQRATGNDESIRMPPGGKLSDPEIKLLKWWERDGFLHADECEARGGGQPDPEPAYVSIDTYEKAIQDDLANLNETDQDKVFYLDCLDLVDAGAGEEELENCKAATFKAVNAISDQRALYTPVEVEGLKWAWRVEQDEIGIEDAEYQLIEDASPLQLESFTTRGVQIKGTTKKRLPWFHTTEFQDVVLRNASIYYKLTDAPATFPELVVQQGVDFADDLKNLKASCVGFNGSLLSPAANRLMCRWDAKTNGGAFHVTFDTGPIVSDEQNLFTNPLLNDAGGDANLKFAAGEVIYTRPNGMLGFYLALARAVNRTEILRDARGNPIRDSQGRIQTRTVFDHVELFQRLDFADPNVVHDFTTNPLSPFIRNAISCFNCHYAGYLRHVDEVGPGLASGRVQVGANDAQIVRALFKPQSVVDSLFAKDNGAFAATLRSIGNDATKPDPVTKAAYKFLGDLKLANVAGIFLQKPAAFDSLCIGLSQKVNARIGQLSGGGTASHDQLVLGSKDIQQECRTFQNPL
jgi:hypothetical protein